MCMAYVKDEYNITINISSKFKLCSHSFHSKIVAMDSLCEKKPPKKTKSIVFDYLKKHDYMPTFGYPSTRDYHMFGKFEYPVYGNGHHCLMKKHTLVTSMSIWGEKYESLRTDTVKLNKDDCNIMIIRRKCKDSKMDCDGDSCSYSAKLIPDFKWLQEKTIVEYSCSFSPKLIMAKTLNDSLFSTNCKVKDMFCLLHDSIIIWNSTVYHECPFYKIGKEKLTQKRERSDILYSDNNIAVQVISFEENCNTQMLETVEGLYLARYAKDTLFENQKAPISQIKEMRQFLLAESDFRFLNDVEEKNDIIYNECLNFKSILNLFSKTDNKYLTHYLSDGSSITFYANLGTVYKADCVDVPRIEVLINTRKDNGSLCFVDQPVIFKYKKARKTGFLAQNGIIKQISELIECSKIVQYIEIPNNNLTIVRNNFRSNVFNNSDLQLYEFDYYTHKIKQLEVHHNPLLLDGIDLLSTFLDVNNHETSSGIWYTHETEESNIRAKFLDSKSEIENGLKGAFFKISSLFIIGAIISILLLVFFCILIKHFNF